jgi:hypothetical protein
MNLRGLKRIPFFFKAVCSAAMTCAIMLASVSVKADNPPPFLLPNDPAHEERSSIHTLPPDHGGNPSSYEAGYTNQVAHPDILYFPAGWGNANGKNFKYWMGITGSNASTHDYEQPAILVSDNLDNDTWEEPAGNAYHTNPLSGRTWPPGSSRHYAGIDIVYNDDVDEIWAYVGKGDRLDLYKSGNGVVWATVAKDIISQPGLSPSVVKEGNDWLMWMVDDRKIPNSLVRYRSTDGVEWTFDHDAGYGFRTGVKRDLWHIDVIKYDGEYWGFLVEADLNSSGGNSNLTLIKSHDGITWTGYDAPILDINPRSWDSDRISRSSFLIENGKLEGIYTAMGANSSRYAGYTSHAQVGGSGWSSNVYLRTLPPLDSYAPIAIIILIAIIFIIVFQRRRQNARDRISRLAS